MKFDWLIRNETQLCLIGMDNNENDSVTSHSEWLNSHRTMKLRRTEEKLFGQNIRFFISVWNWNRIEFESKSKYTHSWVYAINAANLQFEWNMTDIEDDKTCY